MDANVVSGSSGVPGGSDGFSKNSVIVPSSSDWMQPNACASERGTRMPATVAALPEAMWSSTICEGSMR